MIFMQSDEEAFLGPGAESFLYADARNRGYYPVFQSLAAPGFLGEDSNIFFVIVVGDRSYRVERQPHEVTRAEVMAVLRTMFRTRRSQSRYTSCIPDRPRKS